MSQPFDLDAAVTDAAGEPFRFTWGGEEHELPPLLAMDVQKQLEIIKGVEDAEAQAKDPVKLLALLTLIVGQDTLNALSAKRPMSAIALMRLLDGWMAQQGASLGKSSASPESSASTAPPSKPTSRSSRARKTR